MYSSALLSILSLVGATLAHPAAPKVQARATVGHDELTPIATRVQSGTNGDIIKANAPALHIAHGCEVYTAVNDNGDTR